MLTLPPAVHLQEATFAVEQLAGVGRRRGAVVLLPELWGINAQIRGVAARLAAEGFDVYVPELIAGAIEPTADREAVAARYAKSDDVLAVKKIAHVVDAIRLAGEPGPVVALGFCYGGRMALHAAAMTKVDAAISFYGTLGMPSAIRPLDPRLSVRDARVPVQAHYGADDASIPPADVAFVRTTLARPSVFVYEGAGHAFMNETRDSYRSVQARDAWARVLDFLLAQEQAYRLGRGQTPEKEAWELEVSL